MLFWVLLSAVLVALIWNRFVTGMGAARPGFVVAFTMVGFVAGGIGGAVCYTLAHFIGKYW